MSDASSFARFEIIDGGLSQAFAHAKRDPAMHRMWCIWAWISTARALLAVGRLADAERFVERVESLPETGMDGIDNVLMHFVDRQTRAVRDILAGGAMAVEAQARLLPAQGGVA